MGTRYGQDFVCDVEVKENQDGLMGAVTNGIPMAQSRKR